MLKMRTARLFLLCWVVCAGITLFLAAPAAADWTDLESMLDFDTEIFVLGPDPNCPGETCIPGLVELPVFDEFDTQQITPGLYDIVKVQATLTIAPDMPLPIKIRVVFGGLGYQTAPRDWTLRNPGTYTTSAYFMVSGDGAKTIGAKAQVKWLSSVGWVIDSNTILDTVFVGE
jgi:hypothetical protein